MVINDLESLGVYIRKCRKNQGITQRQLAAIAGVSPRFVGEVERGKVTMEIGRALRVVFALGLTVEIKGGEEK